MSDEEGFPNTLNNPFDGDTKYITIDEIVQKVGLQEDLIIITSITEFMDSYPVPFDNN
jgi:uncharacterized YccA/Bax inhibitor family protein